MGRKSIVVNLTEGRNTVNVELKKVSDRYITEFINCNCAPDLIEMELFPNAKEITESFAAYQAVRKEISGKRRLDDEKIVLLAVGDGSSPRTAATFAFRSRWQCHSIDPDLKLKGRWGRIDRLTTHRKRIEDCKPQDFGITSDTNVVIVAVHSHARLPEVLNVLNPHNPEFKPRSISIVSMPCCVEQSIPGFPPDQCYDDWSVFSPERTVLVWQEVSQYLTSH